MARFKSVVDKVINSSDIVLQIIDSRFIEETRNPELEKKIRLKRKTLLNIINKCEFLQKDKISELQKKIKNSFFVSARENVGIKELKKEIKKIAHKRNLKNPIVGVIGYPNTGKSSIINILKGKKSAKTSPDAGFTKGQQYIKIDNSFLMIDTPGIIPRHRTNEEDLVLIGAKNPHLIEDPVLAVMNLISKNPDYIKKRYKISIKEDLEETIADISLKLNIIKKGGIPDIKKTSIVILQNWIKNKK